MGRFLVFLVFSSALLVGSDAAPSVTTGAGPFDLSFSDMQHCPEPSKGIRYELKMDRKRKLLFSNVTMGTRVDDELGISVKLAKQTNQGWKENVFVLEVPNACTNIKAYVPLLDRYLGEQFKCGTCPYPTGNYSMEVSLQFDNTIFAVFPYGKYRAKANLVDKKRKRVFCIFAFFDVVPKKSG